MSIQGPLAHWRMKKGKEWFLLGEDIRHMIANSGQYLLRQKNSRPEHNLRKLLEQFRIFFALFPFDRELESRGRVSYGCFEPIFVLSAVAGVDLDSKSSDFEETVEAVKLFVCSCTNC